MKNLPKSSKSRKSRRSLILKSRASKTPPLIQRIRAIINISCGNLKVVLGEDFQIGEPVINTGGGGEVQLGGRDYGTGVYKEPILILEILLEILNVLDTYMIRQLQITPANSRFLYPQIRTIPPRNRTCIFSGVLISGSSLPCEPY